MSSTVSMRCNVDRFLREADEIAEGFLFVMFTDEIWVEKWPLEEEKRESLRAKEDVLLEARAFSRDREDKLFRGDIGRVFLWRSIEDSDMPDSYDEEQYLDIDEKRSQTLFAAEHKVRATGGGVYHLPILDYRGAKVRIRNYVDYYKETGQAYVRDWRLVEFFLEKEEEKKKKAGEV